MYVGMLDILRHKHPVLKSEEAWGPSRSKSSFQRIGREAMIGYPPATKRKWPVRWADLREEEPLTGPKSVCMGQQTVSYAMFNGFLKDARFAPMQNLHTCVSQVSRGELYRIEQCVGWRFSPVAFFFVLTRPRAKTKKIPWVSFQCWCFSVNLSESTLGHKDCLCFSNKPPSWPYLPTPFPIFPVIKVNEARKSQKNDFAGMWPKFLNLSFPRVTSFIVTKKRLCGESLAGKLPVSA